MISRIKTALAAFKGKAYYVERARTEAARAEAYQAVAQVAYRKLCDMSHLAHNGRHAKAAVLFLETQAVDAGLKLTRDF